MYLDMSNFELTGSIHTLSLKTNDLEHELSPELKRAIGVSLKRLPNNQFETRMKLNLNKLSADLQSYEEFDRLFCQVQREAGIKDYTLIRVDFRLDSYSPGFYRDYEKLFRYLIAALSCAYSVENNFLTNDLFTDEQLSVSAKNRALEIEFYDKFAQSHGTDAAFARLEQRSKSNIHADLAVEFVEVWGRRWNKALAALPLVSERLNEVLLSAYKEDQKQDHPRFRGLTDFLSANSDRLFTRAQVIDFFRKIPDEVKNPEQRFDSFIRRKKDHILLMQDKDVRLAVDEIKRATRAFFLHNQETEVALMNE